MAAAGIVSEYNPFHSGHALHIARTRERLGADTEIVCAMSGNFTQRGDLAIFEKHARAAAAVKCGADLVLELPLPWALSSAEGFAQGAVSLLGAAGCTHISFGSESADEQRLCRIAECLLTERAEELLRDALKKGLSYAAARFNAARELLGEQADILRSPNDLLGTEYIMAARRKGLELAPCAVRREGAAHDGGLGVETASASALRLLLLDGGDTSKYIPAAAAEIFSAELEAGRAPVSGAAVETALLAALRRAASTGKLAGVGNDGLEGRLSRAAKEPSLAQVVSAAKTRRYPESRIRRAILRTFLGVPDAAPDKPPYLRALAMNDRGAAILGRLKETQIIVKPASYRKLDAAAGRTFELEAASTDLYALAYPEPARRRGGTEYTISPVKL